MYSKAICWIEKMWRVPGKSNNIVFKKQNDVYMGLIKAWKCLIKRFNLIGSEEQVPYWYLLGLSNLFNQ